MIIIKLLMNVLPAKKKEILLTLLALLQHPENEKGCLSYGIFVNIEDENAFSLISEWKTRKCLEFHLKSDRFSILLGTKSLLSEPMTMQIQTVSDQEGMEVVLSARKKMSLPKGSIKL